MSQSGSEHEDVSTLPFRQKRLSAIERDFAALLSKLCSDTSAVNSSRMSLKQLKGAALILGFESGWQAVTSQHKADLAAELRKSFEAIVNFRNNILKHHKRTSTTVLGRFVKQEARRLKKLKDRGLRVNEDAIRANASRALDASVHFYPSGSGSVIAIPSTTVSGTPASRQPLVLTCAHCMDHDDDRDDENDDGTGPGPHDIDRSGRFKLVFWSNGRLGIARCAAFHNRHDCALLEIRAIVETPPTATLPPNVRDTLTFVCMSASPPPDGLKVVCIHNPDTASGMFEHDPFTFSVGAIECYSATSKTDASELGPVWHSCWTFWGTSGAPLFDRTHCTVTAIHNSWNDETAQRHGASWEAITELIARLSTAVGKGQIKSSTGPKKRKLHS